MSRLRFDWDEAKAAANRRKHGVSFEEASTIFYDENALLIADPDHSEEEDRFLLLGLSSPFHKFGHVYLDLEARWTIGNFGHGMPCPYISRQPIDL